MHAATPWSRSTMQRLMKCLPHAPGREDWQGGGEVRGRHQGGGCAPGGVWRRRGQGAQAAEDRNNRLHAAQWRGERGVSDAALPLARTSMLQSCMHTVQSRMAEHRLSCTSVTAHHALQGLLGSCATMHACFFLTQDRRGAADLRFDFHAAGAGGGRGGEPVRQHRPGHRQDGAQAAQDEGEGECMLTA